MKKLLLTTLLLMMLAGCKKQPKTSLLVPAGSPLIAVAGMLDNVEADVTIGPDLLRSEFIKQEKDIIIAPVIIGAKLFISESSNYQLAAVIGYSNLYIASKNPLTGIKDLEDKTMLAFAEHSTPGIVLKTVLNDQNTSIEWGKDVKEMVGPFLTGKHDTILTAEPSLSILKEKVEGIHTLSLENLLDVKIIQVGVFINPKTEKKKVDGILRLIEENIAKLKDNPEGYARDIIGVHPQLKEFGVAILKESIPHLNIAYQNAKDSQLEIEDFFKLLNNANQEILLNKLPKNTFYYEK